jgi:hypothetical protein
MAWSSVESWLKLADEGIEALNTKTTYGVVCKVTNTSRPAVYEANSNTCTLNAALKAPTLASYFVHEMVHAQFQNTGSISDINELTQADYVKEMVTEEYIATTRQYQFFVRLDVNGYLPAGLPAADMPPRYQQYRSAYNVGVERARQTTSSVATLHLNGVVNANSLLKIFVTDRGLGVGILSYTEYYGREWQKNKLRNP